MKYAGTLLAVLFLALLSASIIQFIVFYTNFVYPLDIAKEWVSRAAATNDLSDMAIYLNKSYTILLNYHGNPGWPFPTPDTDYDQIRTNILEVIRNCEGWTNQTGTSMAYQQAVHNLADTTTEIYTHLGDANGLIYTNPYMNPMGCILTFSYLLYIILALYLTKEAY